MKKDDHLMHKILLLIIGALSIALTVVLILKAYEFHQDKVQMETWEARHVEVQAEVDDVRMKIQELSEDGEALQAFLDESLGARMEEGLPEMETGVMEGEADGIQKQQKEEGSTGEEPLPAGSEEGMIGEAASSDGGFDFVIPEEDAIIIDTPEQAMPQAGQEDGISDNSVDVAQPEDTVSSNQMPEGEEETVSGNGDVPLPEEDMAFRDEDGRIYLEGTVSGNEEAQAFGEETVSGNGDARVSGEETVSGNRGVRVPLGGSVSGNGAETVWEEDAVSGNELPDEKGDASASDTGVEDGPYGSISGNAIVDGKVIPFRYDEASLTLEARRNIRSSYEETEQVNGQDKEIINNRSYDFSNTTIACLGDSITSGSNLDQMENYQQYSYPAVLKNILHAKEVYNLGIGGSSYGRYWDKAFVDRYGEIPEDTDIILVMGGTNDGFAASKKELGSLEEKKPKTYYGDVDELMRGLREKYPEAKIIFATPLPNVLHDYLRNQRDYLLPQSVFAKAVKELAAQYGIEVIDLYNSNLLDTHDARIISRYMPDGVHGNPDGYRVLAEHLASRMIQIMEKDSLAEPTVSGNYIGMPENQPEAGVSGNGLEGSISGNRAEEGSVSDNSPGMEMISHMEDGKWIEEETSVEERVREEKKAEENARKAAQEAVVVEPAGQDEKEPEPGMPEESIQENAEEEKMEEPEMDYEYDGEAIIIQ